MLASIHPGMTPVLGLCGKIDLVCFPAVGIDKELNVMRVCGSVSIGVYHHFTWVLRTYYVYGVNYADFQKNKD